MKQAYFMYKCRRCGEKYASPSAIHVSQAMKVLEGAIIGIFYIFIKGL